MKSSDDISIGELAAKFGLATHVLRHWEEMGLLTPARLGNGRRVYRSQDITRIGLILLGKEAGLTLEQVCRLFDNSADRDVRRALYQQHHDELTRHISAAQAALEIIDHAIQCDADDIATCPGLQAKLALRVRSARETPRKLSKAGSPPAGAVRPAS
jgi:MerR family copper efflux transcriptional regulator